MLIILESDMCLYMLESMLKHAKNMKKFMLHKSSRRHAMEVKLLYYLHFPLAST